MRTLKRYLPPLFTLLLIALGAAMPWLASWGQDARISKLQEKLELNAVSLTLQKEASVEPALMVVTKEHTSIPWEGETRMTEQEVLDAAIGVIGLMNQYELLPMEEPYLLAEEEGGWAEALLLIGEDGSTALVWNCFWKASSCVIAVDDASGKAVQFLVNSPERFEKENLQDQTEQWGLFFQNYYSAELVESEELTEDLSLAIYEDYIAFNF